MRAALGVIPARYGSQRFPGKPLALINGRPMLQHVFERASSARSLSRIIIATDDSRILTAAERFGAEAVLTSSSHATGTERVAEAAEGSHEPIVINIQGDEPLLDPGMIDRLVEALQDDGVPMATLARREKDLNLAKSPDLVKVAADNDGFALYFSRSAIPAGPIDYFLHHIGIYGFQRTFLIRFAQLPATRLEQVERLEQLRALEHGFRIKILETEYSSLSVDSPADIIVVENLMRNE